MIDCKHFPTAELTEHEIYTTLDYKRRSRGLKGNLDGLVRTQTALRGFLMQPNERGFS